MLWLTMWGCGTATLQILPKEPKTTDVMQVSATDPNGEFIAVTDVAWYLDGVLTVDARELSANWTNRGDHWSAEATFDNGMVVMSESVEIVNSPPEMKLTIVPDLPTSGYPVTCYVDVIDADDDAVTHTVYWQNNEGTRVENASLSPTESTVGTWTCHVEADDSFDMVQESITVDIMELPDLPNESAYLSDTSFEEGDGWIFDGCVRVQERQGKMPYDGSWMIFGQQDDCLLTQRVDLLANGYAPQHIDASRLRVHVGGYLANSGEDDDYDDQVRLRVTFLDEDEAELSTLDSLFAGVDYWIYRDAQRMIPVGTRYLKVQVWADWRADQWNDSFVDNLSFSIEPASPAEPLLMKEPMLQDYRQDAMKIIWETDGVDHDPLILWGDNLENQVTNIRSTWINEEHIVHVGVIEGLEPGQEVQYQVPVQDFEPFMFSTAPAEGEEFSIVWLGDNQEAYGRFADHINNFAPKEPDMLFVVGDLLQWGSHFWEWDSLWWEPLQIQNFAQTTPILAARGNHDMDHAYSYAYVDLPGDGSSYSFMYGDVWILVLNSHADLYPTNDPNFPGQYEYIEEELQSDAAQNAAFRLVAFHQAPYSNSSASSMPDQIYGNEGIRRFWVPLFQQYDVDSVISGHYHSYQRGELNGIQYLITGGGGSTLLIQEFDVWDWLTLNLTYQYTLMIREGNELRWETYDLDENLIDTWTITR